MADDPIRAALAAAEGAVGRSLHEDGLPAALAPQWHAEAAAAITAFLRRLAEHHEARVEWVAAEPYRALAAAVERAAKEAGNG